MKAVSVFLSVAIESLWFVLLGLWPQKSVVRSPSVRGQNKRSWKRPTLLAPVPSPARRGRVRKGAAHRTG